MRLHKLFKGTWEQPGTVCEGREATTEFSTHFDKTATFDKTYSAVVTAKRLANL